MRDAAGVVEERPNDLVLVVRLAVLPAVGEERAELLPGEKRAPQAPVEIRLVHPGLEQCRGLADEPAATYPVMLSKAGFA